jgi:hypothetical protein
LEEEPVTKDELLADIAKGRSVAQRLPLYAAAMQLGLLTFQEIQKEVHRESVPAKQTVTNSATAKKAPAKKAAAVKGGTQ